jgi:hypothetical protein
MADPSTIFGANLVAWYKSDAGTSTTTDGNPISQWDDQSGNSHNLTATGTAEPLYKTAIRNGMPVVRFDGVNDKMVASFTMAIESEVFTACSFLSGAGTAYVYSQSGTASWWSLDRTAADTMTAGLGSTLSLTGVTPNAWHEWDACYTATTGAALLQMDYSQRVTGTDSSRALGGISVGGSGNNTYYGNLDVGEIVILNRVATDAERAQMNYYFANRWAIPNNSGITGFVPRVMVY